MRGDYVSSFSFVPILIGTLYIGDIGDSGANICDLGANIGGRCGADG